MSQEQIRLAEQKAREIEEAQVFPRTRPPYKAILYAVHVLLTHVANQRRATGGKFRAADEAEAAGDDQVRVGIIAIQAVHCPMRKSFPTDSCRLSG